MDDKKQKLKELYIGYTGRSTAQPTTKMLLEAFNNLTLVIAQVDNRTIVKLSDLNPVQLRILEYLKIPPEIYLGFNELFFSHFDFSET